MKNQTPKTLKEQFINNTGKGTEFEISPRHTGEHHDDGSITFNEEGLIYRQFSNIEDFCDYYFLKKKVDHKASYNVGERNENGGISWHIAPFDLSKIDENEDGDAVYTKFVDVTH